MAESLQNFGGEWTEKKLKSVERYLQAYVTALKKQSFELHYIDAFAGTGYREVLDTTSADQFPIGDMVINDTCQFHEGSAIRALKIKPPFNRYWFVEKDPVRCRELKRLAKRFPELADHISIENGDANQWIREFCRSKWIKRRAVLFLDPFGMQVEWATIQSIAKTEGIDLWYLFPLGAGVNRLLPKNGVIPEGWRKRLNLVYGTNAWESAFYKRSDQLCLFGSEYGKLVKCGDFQTIADFTVERLKEIFPAVAPNPMLLYNSHNCPLYLLCFAASNPGRGGQIAVNIASHILKME